MTVISLQSKDHGELLDVIDELRSQGLSTYVSLPQIIVCGDQSAGKSSVLEAISGIPFPTKDNLCTRFATELILRRAPSSSMTVTIVPDDDRTDEEAELLRRFKSPASNLEDLAALVDAAKEAMGLNHVAKAFSKDVLRVEVSGPEQDHLTLVDLPGLIHSESRQQSAEDVDLIKSLVESYMSNPRSVILAVVSAKNDYANQIVTKLARVVDRQGRRTLGIITKPDTLHVGSESERDFVNLARNNEVNFRLGWHVLRNRDFDTKHWTRNERDAQEREFFSQGIWQTLPFDMLGVATLRPRLSSVLKDQIVAELPNVIRDVESGIADCQRTLQRLGEARGTASEQRTYLTRVSQAFSTLLRSATSGIYEQEFFGDARTDTGFKKRLRAVAQSLLLDFAEEMRTEGHSLDIVDEDAGSVRDAHPPRILRSKFIEEVTELIRRTRGRELPGTFNPMIIGDLFFHQAQPWRDLVHEYGDRLVAAARATVELILTHTTDSATAENLLREIVNPALDSCMERLRVKIEEILRPHEYGHPITYNHFFIENIQRARKEHKKKKDREVLVSFFSTKRDMNSHLYTSGATDIERLLEELNEDGDSDMDRFACSEATFCMEAYYQIAMKAMIDNFAVLGVESCLLESLTSAFTPEVVIKFEDGLINGIAAESDASTIERDRTTQKLRVLENGLHVLNRSRRHNQVEPDVTPSRISTNHDLTQKVQENSPAASSAKETPVSNPIVPEVINEELSPFDRSGNFRADDSWRELSLSPPRKKKPSKHYNMTRDP